MNGVLIVNKPPEFTSFDAVAVVRKASGQKKIGHTGTLDPNATGVLPLLLGNATKAQDIIPNHDKEYLAGFQLGLTSDTLDIWGNVTERKKSALSKADIKACLINFAGRISQIPPMFSAVQKDGRRLYDLARQGIEVERKPRQVTVYDIRLMSFDEQEQRGFLQIKCSRGTYIRTVIDDMGKLLGCGAVMSSLERLSACGYTLEDALTLEEIKGLAESGSLEAKLKSTESLFSDYPPLWVTSAQAKRFSNGGALDILRTALARGCEDNQLYRVKERNGGFLGLGVTDKEKSEIKIYKLFL